MNDIAVGTPVRIKRRADHPHPVYAAGQREREVSAEEEMPVRWNNYYRDLLFEGALEVFPEVVTPLHGLALPAHPEPEALRKIGAAQIKHLLAQSKELADRHAAQLEAQGRRQAARDVCVAANVHQADLIAQWERLHPKDKTFKPADEAAAPASAPEGDAP